MCSIYPSFSYLSKDSKPGLLIWQRRRWSGLPTAKKTTQNVHHADQYSLKWLSSSASKWTQVWQWIWWEITKPKCPNEWGTCCHGQWRCSRRTCENSVPNWSGYHSVDRATPQRTWTGVSALILQSVYLCPGSLPLDILCLFISVALWDIYLLGLTFKLLINFYTNPLNFI